MKNLSKSVVAFYGSFHFLFFLLFLYFIIFGLGHCHAGTVSLKYLGNAFVKIITSEGKVIYIDPYAINQSDPADIVLISHEHECHNDLTRIIQKSTCKIYRTSNSLLNGVYQTFTEGNIKITAVPAYNQYHLKSEGVGFIVEFDGIKLYHAGGTGKISEMSQLTSQRIDYAFYPMSPGPESMTQAAAIVNAVHDIPIHSNVSLDRTPSLSMVARFTSPNKLVLDTDQTINLVHQAALIHRVPLTYSTIQAAINAAVNGDTVLVSEGTYYENINYKGKGIVVTSKFYLTKNWQTVSNTIIDGSKAVNKDTASVVQFLSREDSTAVLDGFTITGGTGTKYLFPNGTGSSKYQEGAGIVMHYSSAVIKNNIIVNNVTKPQPGTSNGGGGGIASMYGNPTIINNFIASNVAGYAGGIVLNWSGGKVRNNIIYHNSISSVAYGNGGIMIWQVPKNSAWVENNTIVGNTSLKDAGGISISLASSDAIPVVKNNIVWANRQATGQQVLLPQNVFYNNIEDYSDATNTSVDPKINEDSFMLADNSPCIDAGDPTNIYNDLEDKSNLGRALSPSKGALRNDLGTFGGKLAAILPTFNVSDMYISTSTLYVMGSAGKDGVGKVELLNISSGKFTVDSIIVNNKTLFTLSANCRGKIFNLFEKDTVCLNYRPTSSGIFNDTIKIYHKANGLANPIKVAVKLLVLATEVEEEKLLNYNYELYQNYPNPFNPTTQIRFSIADRSHVSLKIYDMLGKNVESLIDDEMESGEHSVTWKPGSKVSSGIYFVNLVAGKYSETKKIILMK